MKPYAALLASALLVTLPLAAQTPVDPKSPIPGYPDGRGPKGPVTVKIVSPTADEVIPWPAAVEGQPAPKGARVEVKVTVENFETWKDEATGRGQHVQLVLDGRALPDWFQTDKPWIFPALAKGTHTLLAFVQRSWEEAIREPGAFAAVTFHVGEKNGKPAFDMAQPAVSVGGPRGKFKKAESAKIVFDVYVTGCKVGPATDPEACQIVYRLNQDPQQTLTAWAPAIWENVPVGKHSYVVALYKGEKRIEAPFALAQGSFEVADEAAAPAAPAAPAAQA
ncbi:MAG TPA: hypothetical protein VE129_20010, partial [Thermoanaerobaculia bacterium]|nr:hypothetical protein [Thermoanaerobaculia bacterium]